ncbi:polysaccharide biosynthesis/export family protein [Salidesulfovibrio brasiliensis]|uniref:polysaccharide biosynthesis/export family protein n=1 Tax=Salidesulfovibrio brasiliensis TaxID=221711 RepID=UPI0006D01B5F|nr:polysaccharide biosynthesis/export family protein [Salidesulfovibrio brasiliensis]
MKKIALLVFCLVLLGAVSAFANEYVIGEGDIINVRVWGEDELSSAALVRPDGMISLPGIEDVRASGSTLDQLRGRIAESLSRLVKDPVVNVSLAESSSSKVYIVGGGVKSGVYDLKSRVTLLQLLASVGSMETADLKEAYVYRKGEKVFTDLHGLFKKGEFDKDIKLQPGDTVFIPMKEDLFVYVLGAVNQPKAVFCREGLTVLDALLEAGSFNKYADEERITVVRKDGENREEMTVNGEALVEKGELSQNLALKPGDYVIVQESFF